MKFCRSDESGITSGDLSMKGLRSIAARNFSNNKIIELGSCLDEFEKEEMKVMNFRAKIIRCAGVSVAAGLLTSYAGGSGGVAAAIGLGCFSYETSKVYENYLNDTVD